MKFLKNKWNKLILEKGKLNVYRDIMYLVIFSFIGYFFVHMNMVLHDMGTQELKPELENNLNPDYLSPSNPLYQNVVIDYNLTTAGYMRKIVVDLIQIISLLVVFLMIYVHHAFSYYGIAKD